MKTPPLTTNEGGAYERRENMHSNYDEKCQPAQLLAEKRRDSWIRRHGLRRSRVREPRAALLGRNARHPHFADHVEVYVGPNGKKIFCCHPHGLAPSEIEAFARERNAVIFCCPCSDSWYAPGLTALLIIVPAGLSAEYVKRETAGVA
jgi:cytosine/adenosine deaminase-related metal-dependent hydrolase